MENGISVYFHIGMRSASYILLMLDLLDLSLGTFT